MTKKRVNEVDLLRFIAALSVVFFHYCFRGYAADGMSTMPYPLLASLAQYGYLGVDLFFLISGFVILMTASDGSLRKFIVSRIARLYPAFWVCCTATFIAIVAMGAPRHSASFVQYLINMTMLSDFTGVPSIDGVYWSLFIELKFYALVALLLIFRQIHRTQLFLVLWLLATAALDIYPSWQVRSLLIIDYAPYFIAGATFFGVWSEGFSPLKTMILLAAWLLALHHATEQIMTFERHYGTDLDVYVVGGVVSLFFVLMFLVAARRTGTLGRKKWVAVGALTYPLYLLHQNIGYMIFNHAYPRFDAHTLLYGTLFLMLAAAYLVNVGIERKCSKLLIHALNHAWEVWRRRRSRERGDLTAI